MSAEMESRTAPPTDLGLFEDGDDDVVKPAYIQFKLPQLQDLDVLWLHPSVPDGKGLLDVDMLDYSRLDLVVAPESAVQDEQRAFFKEHFEAPDDTVIDLDEKLRSRHFTIFYNTKRVWHRYDMLNTLNIYPVLT